MSHPNPYGQWPPRHPAPPPQQGWSQPAGPWYPPPKPPAPIHHYVTWPAAALGLIALVVMLTARVMDYQMVIVLGFVALLAGIAALAVSVKRANVGTGLASGAVLLIGVFVIIAGFAAMGEYNNVIDELRNFGNSLTE